jgi:hypothetical protein
LPLSNALAGKVKRYAFAQSFSRLLKEQGPAGLWRGNTPYLLRHVPSVALSFTFKDALRDALLPRWAMPDRRVDAVTPRLPLCILHSLA